MNENFLKSLPVLDRVRLRGHATLEEVEEIADMVGDWEELIEEKDGLEEEVDKLGREVERLAALVKSVGIDLKRALGMDGRLLKGTAREALEECMEDIEQELESMRGKRNGN